MSARAFTIGVDFGTSSVRALVVDCEDGRELGTRVFDYPSGDQGVLLDPKQPHLARQNPADYIEGLRESLRGALLDAERDPGFSRQLVVGIGVDTTGSTPLPVDAEAHPLAFGAWARPTPTTSRETFLSRGRCVLTKSLRSTSATRDW